MVVFYVYSVWERCKEALWRFCLGSLKMSGLDFVAYYFKLKL